MTKTAGKLPATLIPGDGIGPEIMKSAVDILEALGSPFEWETRQGGWRPPAPCQGKLARSATSRLRVSSIDMPL